MPNTAPDTLPEHHIVVALIHGEGSILIAKRPDHVHKGGLWEFPGGKVEAGESPRQALDRELMEELAIRVVDARPWGEIRHRYADKAVRLDIWQVKTFEGQARGSEGQEVAWVRPGELGGYRFPEANKTIVEELILNSEG